MSDRSRSAGSSEGVAAVDRAFAILEALAGRDEPSSLAEIARATGFYKSTILRLASSLEHAGHVARLGDGRYALGGSAFRLGLAYERQNPLRRQVVPVLHDLVRNGTESASFHVPHGPGTRLCLFRVNSGHATVDRVEGGAVLPLAQGAAGRVILAHAAGAGPDRAGLREAGVALSRGERDPSCAGLAAPVFGPAGTLVGALSLSGPGERFTDEAVEHMRALLLAAAARLTSGLGSHGPADRPGASRTTLSSG